MRHLYQRYPTGVNTSVNSANSDEGGVEKKDDLFFIDMKLGAEDEI